MKTKKTLSLLRPLILCALLASPTISSAQIVTVDFEELSGISFFSGSPVPLSAHLGTGLLSTMGVSFRCESGIPYVAVVNLGAGHATTGINGIGAVDAANNLSYGTPFLMEFFLPLSPGTAAATDFVSISSDLFSTSGAAVSMQAYGFDGSLLGTTTAADLQPFTLSIAHAGIHTVRVTGFDSIAWDDLRFNSALVPVPEPSIWAMTAVVATILGGLRMRAIKRK